MAGRRRTHRRRLLSTVPALRRIAVDNIGDNWRNPLFLLSIFMPAEAVLQTLRRTEFSEKAVHFGLCVESDACLGPWIRAWVPASAARPEAWSPTPPALASRGAAGSGRHSLAGGVGRGRDGIEDDQTVVSVLI